MDKAKIFMLFSSSKGNSAYIKYKNDEFLIDCGASARSIEDSLRTLGTSIANLSAISITHEHSDHIRGIHTISKYFDVPFYAPERSCEYIEHQIEPRGKLYSLKSGSPVSLGDTALCPIATPHDSRGSVGFRILAGEERIGYFTDIGHLSEGLLRGLSGCERVVIESNHDIEMLKNGSYPYSLKQRILGATGHLSNEMCAKLLPHLAHHGSRSFMLAHLSEENNTPEIAFDECLCSLKEAGFSVCEEGGIKLSVAPVCGVAELV
jgi:phosphoribosyl 1,2-cyclic phosphodiesterase